MDEAEISSNLQTLTVESRVSQILSAQRAAGSDNCDDCGSVIPEPRRIAAPWAKHCISCQEIIEKRLRNMRRA